MPKPQGSSDQPVYGPVAEKPTGNHRTPAVAVLRNWWLVQETGPWKEVHELGTILHGYYVEGKRKEGVKNNS